jgi:hypothetical protein
VTKTFRFQALALVASMGLTAALFSGCNPEEPAKPTSPPPAASTAVKGGPGKMEPKPAPAPVTPPKTDAPK